MGPDSDYMSIQIIWSSVVIMNKKIDSYNASEQNYGCIYV